MSGRLRAHTSTPDSQPLSASDLTCQRLADTRFQALGRLIRERVAAGSLAGFFSIRAAGPSPIHWRLVAGPERARADLTRLGTGRAAAGVPDRNLGIRLRDELGARLASIGRQAAET